ncbi:unnamed protein product [Prunus armeniaca]|uniref:Glycoside hydrolase family 3 N-terminal domain-containing protein n=1 Tax=Prunus armeniaca TaxID=36596 RepID=A0A6J5XWR3_PRUAR|nr:unnamed protein product [Prunus armeniaca]CAB4316255.1 unnamed protein product [Prunus armeniaca]
MTEIIPGLQGEIPANSTKGVPFVAGNKKVAACAKHYVADGGTNNGINENNTLINKHGLLSIHMPPYYDSIIKGVATIMVSYSSSNGVKRHANRDLVTSFLKNTLRFRGFVISDWEGIDRITSPPHANYSYSIQVGINADIDMFVMGLFEEPLADLSLVNQLGSQEHRELAREAVRKSLVLLKNGESADKPLLPLPKKASKIPVAGVEGGLWSGRRCQTGLAGPAWHDPLNEARHDPLNEARHSHGPSPLQARHEPKPASSTAHAWPT